MRLVRSARRATATTSCDVTPAGLSTSRSPPAVARARTLPLAGILLGGRRAVGVVRGAAGGFERRPLVGLLADLTEQRLDAGGARDALVGSEGDLGGHAQPERAPDAAAQVRGDAGQPLERLALLLVGAH